jgi:hypothetical protein
MRVMRAGRVLALAAALAGVAAPSAHGDFHLMKVSEVFPGTNADVNSAFIELRMFAAGQNLVAGHKVDYYTATGSLLGSYTIAGNVPNGENQRSILIGDTAAAGAPDFVVDQLGDALHPGTTTGGAVCFPDAQPPDCVSWGSFTPQAGFPNPQSANAPVIPDGSSLTRSTAPGCPNLLEPGDDTDNSTVDFALGAPNPTNNSVPGPTACGTIDGPPDTEITKGPEGKIEKDTAKFRFRSTEANSTFACKLDKRAYKSCASPKRYKNLDLGKHKFRVRATDAAGNTDPTPDKAKFEVKKG